MNKELKVLLEEILERVERLEVKVFGMSKEEAEEFFRRYDEAVKNLAGVELDQYIESVKEAMYLAEDVLGV